MKNFGAKYIIYDAYSLHGPTLFPPLLHDDLGLTIAIKRVTLTRSEVSSWCPVLQIHQDLSAPAHKQPLQTMEITACILYSVLAALLCFFIYKYLTQNYDFWEKQNLPHEKPWPFIGTLKWNQPLHKIEKELYEKFGRTYGRFDGKIPVLTVAEPELVKKILVKDFHIFPNRRDLKCNDPIMDNSLFALENHDWKRVRNIVSPTFTSAKLRRMLPLLEASSDDVLKKIETSVSKNEDISCQSIFGGFAMVAIGKCAFGVHIDSKEEEVLIKKAKDLLLCPLSWRTICILLFPKLMKLLRISLLNPETLNYYKSLIKDVICVRKENNQKRSDFLQHMMNSEKKSSDKNNNYFDGVDCNTDCQENSIRKNAGLSEDESMAQCVSFIMAGFDATTSLLSYVTYHLAMYQGIQQRVYDEIKTSLNAHDGVLSFEVLSELKLLDAVMDETLRLCPPLVRIERRAEENYDFDDGRISIKKGMLVSIPIYTMHRDPEWYKDPDCFNPDRFLSEELSPPPYTYLPFGGGPRLCIGKRFVQIGVKMILAKLVLKYLIQVADEPKEPLEIKEVRGTLKVANVDVKLFPR